MADMKNAFLCLHGFGHHPGGRAPGFSAALRRNVEALLGADAVVWDEVLWDNLLGSPSSFGTLSLALESGRHVRAFYEGREGDAVRARVADAVRAVSARAGGAPVVLVGHSFGAAIAYETLARGLAPEAKSLVMLAPPMGLFNNPGAFAAKAAEGMAPGLGLLVGAFAPVAGAVTDFPEVRGDRLPDDVAALSLRSPDDWFAEPLGQAFPDVSEREVIPPPGTRGGANHRFYWSSPEAAESVAAAAVAALSHAGQPPSTAAGFALLSRAAQDSLWSAEQEELDEDGNVIGGSIS